MDNIKIISNSTINIKDVQSAIEDPDLYSPDNNDDVISYIKWIEDKGILSVYAIKDNDHDNYQVMHAEWMISGFKTAINKMDEPLINECINKYIEFINDPNSWIDPESIKAYNTDSDDKFKRVAGYWLYKYPCDPVGEFVGACKKYNMKESVYFKQTMFYLVNALKSKPSESNNINHILTRDPELEKLYLSDPYFKRAIDVAIKENMSIQEALIYALKIGYSAKNEIQLETKNKYMKHGSGGLLRFYI